MTDAAPGPSDGTLEAVGLPKLPAAVELTFDPAGVLPPADYHLTFHELRSSILVHGPSRIAGAWDRDWRLKLVNNLEVLVRQLWVVGIDRIFIDGSFVEDKDHPNDIDGYFEADPATLQHLIQALNTLDPCKCWNWHPSLRRPYKGQPKWQLPMWHNHRVELYPHFGQLCGIKDEFGNDQQFPAAFRKTRGSPPLQKGIVQIVKEER